MDKNTSIATHLKALAALKKTNITQVGLSLGKSKENIHQQFKRDNFKLMDILDIADTLGYDVKLSFVDRETGKVIEVD